MKQLIKRYIIKLTGMDKLESKLLEAIEELEFNNSELRSKIMATQRYLKVCVDVHTRPENENWAIICIAGKPDYVKFSKFRNNDILEIRRFLKNFEYADITCDAPSNMKNSLLWG